MQTKSKIAPTLNSARPEMTRALMEKTGLDEAQLATLVEEFYGRVRSDPLLGPIFAARVTDWPAHMDRLTDFWSSVALMTGRYHGAPVPAHASLPVTWEHFDRWLALFRETAHRVCSPEGAAHVIERAERIAKSLHIAVQDAARTNHDSVPNLL
ncbi:group III truncated hemoglobin [Sedimentitalea todarodis]|uniref:Group III truncated hemoglobin n=1 Tax=Sedimentitalea todarodis TaxID=1631240 RepID=A0ABU3VIM8_9RHOB|nr:group III truncated hemoglobin [Sedimentitalea todarodis]MDU9006027.1 group III truncated hemoglobin [Sedimentitalea todarodis]